MGNKEKIRKMSVIKLPPANLVERKNANIVIKIYFPLSYHLAHGGGYGATTKAFIFSLRNHEGLGPFKSKARHPGRHAIGRYPGFGPTFGHGHDIYIADNANSNNKSYTNFSYHNDYPVPSAVRDGKTVLAGTYHFTPDEVEVFYLG